MGKRIRVKPGKSQSIAGFFGGIVFIFIGIFAITPDFGFFGILWILMAIMITAVNGYNAFSDKGVASWEAEINDTLPETKIEAITFDEKLRRLNKLKEDGLITEEEFQLKKKEILNEKW
ncbi:SHOCT domain-containing protein [Clostridium polynesiense]|uniref:SHOCT domain-containing protein n=1 Tax=Clostridium polynesiense TaxID=1325933 RepID=UPI00058CAF31|nr:SHOCT domain-containing protein [Clostridium polynesiense]